MIKQVSENLRKILMTDCEGLNRCRIYFQKFPRHFHSSPPFPRPPSPPAHHQPAFCMWSMEGRRSRRHFLDIFELVLSTLSTLYHGARDTRCEYTISHACRDNGGAIISYFILFYLCHTICMADQAVASIWETTISSSMARCKLQNAWCNRGQSCSIEQNRMSLFRCNQMFVPITHVYNIFDSFIYLFTSI